jgi:hypothetical protein
MFKFETVGRIRGATAFIVAAMLACGAGPARADFPGYVKSACKKDFKTFCPQYDIDSTALRQCMRSVAGQLSPRCIDALERAGEKRRK